MRQFEVPLLAIELDSINQNADRRDYVENLMVKDIENKSMWLTGWMLQREDLRQIVGDLILGHGVSDGSRGLASGTHATDFPIHPAFDDQIITIESSTDSIEYIDGREPIRSVVVGARNKTKNQQTRERRLTIAGKKATVSLRKAWFILKPQYFPGYPDSIIGKPGGLSEDGWVMISGQRVPHNEVIPDEWKKKLGLPVTQAKELKKG